MKLLKFMPVVALALGLVSLNACNGNKEEAKEETTETPATETPATAAKDTAKLEITGTDQMTYDKKEFTVKAGQMVSLTLTHSGKMTKEAMGHNWVLISNAITVEDFATKAIAAKAEDYIPASEYANTIAHTKLLGAGESDTITFEAPEKGTYNFLCSFPGHFGAMNGKFIVE